VFWTIAGLVGALVLVALCGLLMKRRKEQQEQAERALRLRRAELSERVADLDSRIAAARLQDDPSELLRLERQRMKAQRKLERT
jgi:hypothetical protein